MEKEGASNHTSRHSAWNIKIYDIALRRNETHNEGKLTGFIIFCAGTAFQNAFLKVR
jgi:hypothetical protein